MTLGGFIIVSKSHLPDNGALNPIHICEAYTCTQPSVTPPRHRPLPSPP